MVSASGDDSVICIAFRKLNVRRKTIKPRPGTTVQISIDPYSAGKTMDEKEKVTKPPATIGPRPLLALPPTRISEFILARCVDVTNLFMATAMEAKYSDCINFAPLIQISTAQSCVGARKDDSKLTVRYWQLDGRPYRLRAVECLPRPQQPCPSFQAPSLV
jgi:hypothetical protein